MIDTLTAAGILRPRQQAGRSFIAENSFVVDDPQLGAQHDPVQRSLSLAALVAKNKQTIDDWFRVEFSEGKISAKDLSEKLTDYYHALVVKVCVASGISSMLETPGVAFARFGGFASGNTGRGSDWDMVMLSDTCQRKLRLTSNVFSDLARYGIEAKVLFRAVDDLPAILNAPGGHGLSNLTGLFRLKLIGGDPATLAALEVSRNELLRNCYPVFVELVQQSVARREEAEGRLYRLASYNLKESRGGLRDWDCISWLDQAAVIATGNGLLDSREREFLDHADTVLRTAKHALHFSAPGKRNADIYRFDNGRRSDVLGLFGQAAIEPISDKTIYDILYSTARRVSNLLDEVIERAADGNSGAPRQRSYLPLLSPAQFGNAFRDLINGPGIIRNAFESGELSSLLPAFANAEHFVDHAGFHRFPLGEHQVRAVEKLAALLQEVKQGTFLLPEFGQEILEDAAPMLLATLLHDTAKPEEGSARNHHERGAPIAYAAAIALGFTEQQAIKTAGFVRDHMLIANLAGHNDRTMSVETVTRRVTDLTHLQQLLLITLADKMESDPKRWRTSKWTNLCDAYEKIKLALSPPESRLDMAALTVQRALESKGGKHDFSVIKDMVARINPRLQITYASSVLTEQVRLLLEVRAGGGQLSKDLFYNTPLECAPDGKMFSLFFVCHDSPGLLARIGNYLAQRRMRIASAHVGTCDGLACDYLRIEPVKEDDTLELNHNDIERFIARLKQAALAKSPARNRNEQTVSVASPAPELGSFQNRTSIELEHDAGSGELFLTILDPSRQDILTVIAPVLEFHKIGIRNAQLGCGNREIRHWLELQLPAEQFCGVDQLQPELESALGVTDRF